MPGIELDPAATAFDGFRAALAHLAGAAQRRWQGVIDDADLEDLHDLRVALRRTRSLLAAAQHVVPDAVRDPARDEFRWLARLTSPQRDLDVTLMSWDGDVAQLPTESAFALMTVLDELRAQRAAAHDELAAALRSARALELMQWWSGWLDRPVLAAAAGRDADTPLGEIGAARIARAHRRLVRSGRSITRRSAAGDLHEVRKRAKDLRYLVECFAATMADAPRAAFLRPLKRLQETLGDHQDAVVLVGRLTEMSKSIAVRAPSDTVFALGQLSQVHRERQARARAAFPGRFAAFDSGSTRRKLGRLLASAAS